MVRLPRTLIEWLGAASLVVLIGFFVVCGGLDILIQVPLLLLFGWPFYLARVVLPGGLGSTGFGPNARLFDRPRRPHGYGA